MSDNNRHKKRGLLPHKTCYSLFTIIITYYPYLHNNNIIITHLTRSSDSKGKTNLRLVVHCIFYLHVCVTSSGWGLHLHKQSHTLLSNSNKFFSSVSTYSDIVLHYYYSTYYFIHKKLFYPIFVTLLSFSYKVSQSSLENQLIAVCCTDTLQPHMLSL